MQGGRTLQHLRSVWDIRGPAGFQAVDGVTLVERALGSSRYVDLRPLTASVAGAGALAELDFEAAVASDKVRWIRWASARISPFAGAGATSLVLVLSGGTKIWIAQKALAAAADAIMHGMLVLPPGAKLTARVESLAIGATLNVEYARFDLPTGEEPPSW